MYRLIGKQSSKDHDEAGTFSIATGATLTLAFRLPYEDRPHFGLRWRGDHMAELNAMLDDGRIVVDSTGLGKDFEVFRHGAYTLIGVQKKGTILFLR